MPYDPNLREEELKNRVAADVFGDFDCARILGAVDFCVSRHAPLVNGQKTKAGCQRPSPFQPFNPSTEGESLLWAEAKAGVRDDFAPLFAQLILTLGKARTFDDHLSPPFLGAFDSEKIAFLPYHEVVDFLRKYANVKVLPITNANAQLETGNIGNWQQFPGLLFPGPEPDLFTAAGDGRPPVEERDENCGIRDLESGNRETRNPKPGTRSFSPAASRVLDAGRRLWRHYHAQPGALPDASFYDIRAHFQGFKPNGHMNPDSPDAEYTRLVGGLRAAMKVLAAQLAPKVREHGFLR